MIANLVTNLSTLAVAYLLHIPIVHSLVGSAIHEGILAADVEIRLVHWIAVPLTAVAVAAVRRLMKHEPWLQHWLSIGTTLLAGKVVLASDVSRP